MDSQMPSQDEVPLDGTSHEELTQTSEDSIQETLKKRSLPARCAMALIRFYQRYISPLFPPCCIYTPTCSEYARQAIEKYGLWKGGILAVKRIMRCDPFHEGGYDPVP